MLRTYTNNYNPLPLLQFDFRLYLVKLNEVLNCQEDIKQQEGKLLSKQTSKGKHFKSFTVMCNITLEKIIDRFFLLPFFIIPTKITEIRVKQSTWYVVLIYNTFMFNIPIQYQSNSLSVLKFIIYYQSCYMVRESKIYLW